MVVGDDGQLEHAGRTYNYPDITGLEEAGLVDLEALPVSVRFLLEAVLRRVDGTASNPSAGNMPPPRDPRV